MSKIIYSLEKIDSLPIEIKSPSLVFLYGDLWAGKTTLSQSLISRYTGTSKEDISSPTYVYYNRYKDLYHFDLYRIEDYDEFVHIWGEDILDNNTGIILIEWPERIEKYYSPDIIIRLLPSVNSNEREIEIEYT